MLHRSQPVYITSDSRLLLSVLNEVLNGFAIDNFDALLGTNRSELEQLRAHPKGLSDGADIRLNRNQTKVFRNALRETLRELGVEEFHPRTGFDFEEGEQVLKRLGHLIKVDESSVDLQP